MTITKFKTVKVKTPLGTRELLFRPAITKEGEKRTTCEAVCPIGPRLCMRLRHPEFPEDENNNFLQFCAKLDSDSEDGDSLQNYIPDRGSIEMYLSDIGNIYEEMIEGKGYVRIVDIIDNVCKTTCPLWNEDHTKCNQNNKLCLLQDLLKNNNYDPSLLDEEGILQKDDETEEEK